MTWDAALDQLDRDGHRHAGRFRELCSEDNPDAEQRDGYRETVVRLAAGIPIPTRIVPVAYGEPGPRPCCGGTLG